MLNLDRSSKQGEEQRQWIRALKNPTLRNIPTKIEVERLQELRFGRVAQREQSREKSESRKVNKPN